MKAKTKYSLHVDGKLVCVDGKTFVFRVYDILRKLLPNSEIVISIDFI